MSFQGDSTLISYSLACATFRSVYDGYDLENFITPLWPYHCNSQEENVQNRESDILNIWLMSVQQRLLQNFQEDPSQLDRLKKTIPEYDEIRFFKTVKWIRNRTECSLLFDYVIENRLYDTLSKGQLLEEQKIALCKCLIICSSWVNANIQKIPESIRLIFENLQPNSKSISLLQKLFFKCSELHEVTADFSFLCKNKEVVKAHANLLMGASKSEWFKKIISGIYREKNSVNLDDIPASLVKDLVGFYEKNLTIFSSHPFDLWKLANRLDMIDLKNHCLTMIGKLEDKELATILPEALLYEDKTFAFHCVCSIKNWESYDWIMTDIPEEVRNKLDTLRFASTNGIYFQFNSHKEPELVISGDCYGEMWSNTLKLLQDHKVNRLVFLNSSDENKTISWIQIINDLPKLNITTLSISEPTFGENERNFLFRQLFNQEFKLKKLEFTGLKNHDTALLSINNLTYRGKQIAHLNSLNIKGNFFDLPTLSWKTMSSYVRNLSIQSNSLIFGKNSYSFFKFFEDNDTLTDLTLGQMGNLEKSHAISLGKALSESHILTRLHLSFNFCMQKKSLKKILENFQSQTLSHLHFKAELPLEFPSDGFITLFKNLQQLVHLEISASNLSNGETSSWIKALKMAFFYDERLNIQCLKINFPLLDTEEEELMRFIECNQPQLTHVEIAAGDSNSGSVYH